MERIHRTVKKKKTLTKLDYYCGVVSHQEPYLESEVKWALGSTAVNKTSGYNGIPVELSTCNVGDWV